MCDGIPSGLKMSEDNGTLAENLSNWQTERKICWHVWIGILHLSMVSGLSTKATEIVNDRSPSKSEIHHHKSFKWLQVI